MGEKELSAIETELYDRQIRLWGIESQEKLRAANVLLIGIRGLGSEIAKDILLSGINSLTILDNGIVTKEEQLVNFLLTPDLLGKNIAKSVLAKAQALNPLVKLTADSDSVDSKDEDFFKQFTIVISTKLGTDEIIKISAWCRKSNVKFISGDVFGMFGYTVSDFQDHEYYEDRVKLPKKRRHDEKNPKTEMVTVKVQARIKYPDLSTVVKRSKTGKMKKCRNIYYYLMLVLLEFRNRHKRDPSYTKRQEDLVSLKSVWADISKDYEVDSIMLNDEIFGLVFGEIVPICSIVGGIVVQEAIKAVSGKEVPINNVFLLNPLTYYGKEETIGIV
ncbi:ubiquitin-activating enzyme e1 [Holotrichia oblita]|uniref:Ubiquitin-activating enzyme e1 n=1 Tax=Holotrichia oblita TaxID=644536 RepID=A0ACB9TGC4_HOLOL|nr:ubiquitin-activating enzyme e1 [Holotrichia oblita]